MILTDSGPGGGVSLVDERDDPGGDDYEDCRDVNQVRVKCQVAVQLKVHFDARERSFKGGSSKFLDEHLMSDLRLR